MQGKSQPTAPQLDKLLKNSLINKEDIPSVNQMLEKVKEDDDPIISSTYLMALYTIERGKIQGFKHEQIWHPNFPGMQILFEPLDSADVSEAEKDSFKTSLIEYIDKLHHAQLLAKPVADTLKAHVTENKYAHILQVLQEGAELQDYHEAMLPDKVLPFVERLYQNKIVSFDKYTILTKHVKEGKITEHTQLIPYCNKAITIHFSSYSNDPGQYLEAIHKHIANRLEFAIDSFKWEEVLDERESDTNHQHYNFLISFKTNGKTYKQRSYHRMYSVEQNKYYSDPIEEGEFYQIFNKVLADRQSPYRLHLVSNSRRMVNGAPSFDLLALTKQQAESLRSSPSHIQVSYENFKSTLTTKKIDAAIKAYKELGLLSHLSADEIEKAQEKVQAATNESLNEVLSHFPNTIYWFDWETGNLENPYEEILQELSKIAKGNFKPENIVDRFDVEAVNPFEFSFTLNGKKYTTQLRGGTDWLDEGFMELIEKAQAENDKAGKFYFLSGDGQVAAVIYLTHQQYATIKSKRLLVFSGEE